MDGGVNHHLSQVKAKTSDIPIQSKHREFLPPVKNR